MGNEVEVVIRGTDKSGDAFDSASKKVSRYQEQIVSVSSRSREAFDRLDAGAMGFRDTITGVQDTMTGFQAIMGQGEHASDTFGDKLFLLGSGIGDLASGMANFIIPVAASVSVLNAQALASARSTAATIAQNVATVAASAASKAWAAAQWVLNAALNANPIGLVVVAIAALVGGLIYAYNHSERFRAIVQAVGEWLKNTLWPALQAVGSFLGGAFSAAWRAAGSAAQWIWDKLVGFKDWFLGTFVGAWATAVAFILRTVGNWASALGGVIAKIPGLGSLGHALENAGRDAQRAADNADAFARSVKGIPSNKTVTFTVRAHYTPGTGEIFKAAIPSYIARSAGGPVGRAASGGPRSNSVLVGENGPEVVDLAPGSMVHPAANSAQMLSGTGSGSQALVTFQFEGAEDEFMRFIRKVFRINGISLGS